MLRNTSINIIPCITHHPCCAIQVYIRVYASNSKGRSTPVILQAETSLAAGVSAVGVLLITAQCRC